MTVYTSTYSKTKPSGIDLYWDFYGYNDYTTAAQTATVPAAKRIFGFKK